MKIRLLNLLMNLKRNTQVFILLESDKSKIISGKIKDIIKSQPVKNHSYDMVEKVREDYGYIIIEISLDM